MRLGSGRGVEDGNEGNVIDLGKVIDLELEGLEGVVDVCGLWFGSVLVAITVGELKTGERRGGV